MKMQKRTKGRQATRIAAKRKRFDGDSLLEKKTVPEGIALKETVPEKSEPEQESKLEPEPESKKTKSRKLGRPKKKERIANGHYY